MLIFLAMCLPTLASSAWQDGEVEFSEDFMALSNEFYTWKLRVTPEMASLSGVNSLDGKLARRSLRDFEKAMQDCQTFADRALRLLEEDKDEASAAAAAADPVERHFLQMMRAEGETCARGIRLKGFLFAPVTFLRGVQSLYPFWFGQGAAFLRLERLADYRTALDRLRAIPDSIGDIIELLEEGILQNVTYAKESLDGVREQFDALDVEDVERSDFYLPFKDIGRQGFNATKVSMIQTEARLAVRDEVLPSFRRLASFIDSTYLSRVRGSPGVFSIANGDKFYQACLDFHTTLDGLTPSAIHDIGLDQVRQLRLQTEGLAGRMGLNYTELLRRALDGDDQLFGDEKEVLGFIRKLLTDEIRPKMAEVIPGEFLIPVLYDLQVNSFSGDGDIAHYTSQGGKGSLNINLRNVRAFRKFEMMSLCMHEGTPGHHLDITAFPQVHRFPQFMQGPSFGTYTSVPSATPFYTAAREGWALYAEFLGLELGLYGDPYQELGFYSWNLLRAARLVADTGLHAFGWSRQRTLDYLLDNTLISVSNAESEVDRYITWPGQATAYKIGEMHIRETRRTFELALGDGFDLRVFHRNILACHGPLAMLEDCLNLYYDKKPVFIK